MSRPRTVPTVPNIPKYWNRSSDMFMMLNARQITPTINTKVPIMMDLTLSSMSYSDLFLRL